jgi:hypothetical protein
MPVYNTNIKDTSVDYDAPDNLCSSSGCDTGDAISMSEANALITQKVAEALDKQTEAIVSEIVGAEGQFVYTVTSIDNVEEVLSVRINGVHVKESSYTTSTLFSVPFTITFDFDKLGYTLDPDDEIQVEYYKS